MIGQSRPSRLLLTALLASCFALTGCGGAKSPPAASQRAQASNTGDSPKPTPAPANTGQPDPKPATSGQPAAQPAEGTQPKVDLAQTVQITREKFDKIAFGMGEKEVRDILGKPTTDGAAENDVKATGWSSTSFAQSITIVFQAGKVTVKTGVGLVKLDAAKLTKANADKIKEGMTAKEVVTLMGPAENESASAPDLGAGISMSWGQTGAKQISVVLREGKVISKEVSGLE